MSIPVSQFKPAWTPPKIPGVTVRGAGSRIQGLGLGIQGLGLGRGLDSFR